MTMKNRTPDYLTQIIGLAAIAGMRSMAAPALATHYLYNNPSKKLGQTRLAFMQSGKTATIFSLLAAGEIMGDKLPNVPDRTETGSLIGRGLSGALVGASLSYAQRKSGLIGAGIGLVSALTATYLSYFLRKKLTEKTAVPGILWGLAEDVVVFRSGQQLLQK